MSSSRPVYTLALSLTLISPSAIAAEHAVKIEGMAFGPVTLALKVGDTVVFTNADGAPHTATASNRAFDTGRLAKGQSATVKIDAAGTVEYFCTVHPSMKASISAK
jgi:plastocyanin